jgi:hypothetical protein
VENLLITFIHCEIARVMEFTFLVVWCYMGYTSEDERVVGELERTKGTPYCFGSVEVDLCLVW